MFFITIWSLKSFLDSYTLRVLNTHESNSHTRQRPALGMRGNPSWGHLPAPNRQQMLHGRSARRPSSSRYSTGIFLDNVLLGFRFSLPHAVSHVNSNWVQEWKSPVGPPHLSLPQMRYCSLQKHFSHLKSLTW